MSQSSRRRVGKGQRSSQALIATLVWDPGQSPGEASARPAEGARSAPGKGCESSRPERPRVVGGVSRQHSPRWIQNQTAACVHTCQPSEQARWAGLHGVRLEGAPTPTTTGAQSTCPAWRPSRWFLLCYSFTCPCWDHSGGSSCPRGRRPFSRQERKASRCPPGGK